MFISILQMKKLSLGKVKFLTWHLTVSKSKILTQVYQILKLLTPTSPRGTRLAYLWDSADTTEHKQPQGCWSQTTPRKPSSWALGTSPITPCKLTPLGRHQHYSQKEHRLRVNSQRNLDFSK